MVRTGQFRVEANGFKGCDKQLVATAFRPEFINSVSIALGIRTCIASIGPGIYSLKTI